MLLALYTGIPIGICKRSKTMATMKEKFQQVKNLLTSVQTSQEAQQAEANLSLATRLMNEIEASMLANPFLQDQDLVWVVQFNRGPLWMVANERVQTLRKSA